MKQNPFSLYDFLGYFIPGAFSFFLIVITNTLKQPNSYFSLSEIISVFPKINTFTILFFIIISYVFGHIISYISSITIEKYSVWKYGYPSKYLLNIKVNNYWGVKKFHSIFWRIVLLILLLPIVILDYLLGHFFGFKNFYSHQLDKMLRKIIIKKNNDLLEKLGLSQKNGFEEGEGNDKDFNRIIMHYAFEHSNNHQNKLTNYVAIYGFLRTLCLISTLYYWYLLFHILIFDLVKFSSIIFLIIVSAISYVFFMAFMKFYRRFTLEGFMIIVVNKETSNLEREV